MCQECYCCLNTKNYYLSNSDKWPLSFMTPHMKVLTWFAINAGLSKFIVEDDNTVCHRKQSKIKPIFLKIYVVV